MPHRSPRRSAAAAAAKRPSATSSTRCSTPSREQGVGELIGWVALTRQREALQPVVDTIPTIVDDFRDAGDERPMDKVTLGLVLMAIGDSLAATKSQKRADCHAKRFATTRSA